jgi:spore coat polysaccharide biosynthesis protein SpsF|tara:strand:+ start:733 stop:1479 length:747 start_codon:yes stop_codon:yes gene_type:complete
MKKLIIVQARMDSTRLPGKVMKVVCSKPLLEHFINRLKRVKSADQIVIATTINDIDNQIVDLCKRLDISYYRGSEEDVLDRYYKAALENNGDVIARITSDCPLIDPDVVDMVFDYYQKHEGLYDYVSNALERTFPRGMDVEVFSLKALKESFEEATLLPDREHVTTFIRMRPQRYSLHNISYKEDCSCLRWTVDTEEDLRLITKIYDSLFYVNPNFSLEDILELVDKNQDWVDINKHITQKRYGEYNN